MKSAASHPIRSASGFGVFGPVGSGPVLTRENPANTAETVGELRTNTVEEVDAIVRSAETAQRVWSRQSIQQRIDQLLSAADAVGETTAELSVVLARELGKPVADSAGEMGFAAAFTRYVTDHAEHVLATTYLDDAAGRVQVDRVPFGVVAAVVPWNAPLILASLKVGPALVSGNSIVVKPSPLAPFAVTAALEAMAGALPAGVLSVVHGEAAVGQALVGHSRVRKVAFTGGEAVGRSVLATTAQHITPAVMELGGNDAALVCEDAVFDDTFIEGMIFGALLTSGQVCMAAKRLYVPQSRMDEFVDRFVEVARRVLVCGDPLNPAVTVGPLVSAVQVAKVSGLVAEAASAGATVTPLGTLTSEFDPERGYFLQPTLVVAENSMAIVQTEQFGPTVPVVGYRRLDQAIGWANDSDLGLASSVWSSDEDHAFAVAQRLEAGTTFINCHNRAGMSLRVPFGGVKRSGFGREFGEAGIAEYSQTHAIHLPGTIRDGQGSARLYPQG